MTDGKQNRKSTVVKANFPSWGEREPQELKRIEANLPAWAKPELRKLKGIMRKGDPQIRELSRQSRKLCAALQSVSPKVNSALLGRAVARLLDSVYYGDVLARNLREIARITGPSKRQRLRSLLTEIQEVALNGQRRQVDGLRRDMPLLLKHLDGGKPHNTRRPRN